jgi:hypothetical protein
MVILDIYKFYLFNLKEDHQKSISYNCQVWFYLSKWYPQRRRSWTLQLPLFYIYYQLWCYFDRYYRWYLVTYILILFTKLGSRFHFHLSILRTVFFVLLNLIMHTNYSQSKLFHMWLAYIFLLCLFFLVFTGKIYNH